SRRSSTKATASASTPSKGATWSALSSLDFSPCRSCLTRHAQTRVAAMYFLYSLLLTLGFVLLLPRFAIDALRNGKYVTGLRQRLGDIPLVDSDRPIIWLHCVSVGEAQSAQSLVRLLKETFPTHTLV